jgi:hypothetical protein
VSKHNDQKQEGLPRSKSSRQKLRRWSFITRMKMETGDVQTHQLPGLSYGNSAQAQQTADDLLAQFKQHEGAPQDVTLIPVGHETISETTMRQLNGLQAQVNLITKAAFILAEKFRLASTTDKSIEDLVGEASNQARAHLFPRWAEAQAKINDLDVEAVTSVEADVVAPKAKRKLGIDAVNAILNNPVEVD